MKIPKGYRFLTEDDIIEATDMFISIYNNYPRPEDISCYINPTCGAVGSVGRHWGYVSSMVPYIRKLNSTPRGNKPYEF